MANIRAFQACDESSILSARTRELMLKALRKKCFLLNKAAQDSLVIRLLLLTFCL